MSEKRSLVAVITVCAVFIAACVAIFFAGRADTDGYTVHTERTQIQPTADADRLIDDRININTATAAELCELPGIGEVHAAEIVEYREKNGRFITTADIMQVKGIGESTYSKIERYITVGED